MRRRGGLMQDDDCTRKDTNFFIACGLVTILENDVVIGAGPIAVHHLVLVRLHNCICIAVEGLLHAERGTPHDTYTCGNTQTVDSVRVRQSADMSIGESDAEAAGITVDAPDFKGCVR